MASEVTSNISGLTSNVTYYVRSYATNSQGTSYGKETSFTTASIPALSLHNTFWEGTYDAPAGTYPIYLRLTVGSDLRCQAGWSNGPGIYNAEVFTGTINSAGTTITWDDHGTWTFQAPWSVSGNSMTGSGQRSGFQFTFTLHRQ